MGDKIHVNPENHRFYLNRTHLMVGAMNELAPIYIEVGYWELRDSILPRIEAFLKGAHLYDWILDESVYAPEFWTNTSNCFHASTNLTWVTLPGWLKYMVADNPSLW